VGLKKFVAAILRDSLRYADETAAFRLYGEKIMSIYKKFGGFAILEMGSETLTGSVFLKANIAEIGNPERALRLLVVVHAESGRCGRPTLLLTLVSRERVYLARGSGDGNGACRTLDTRSCRWRFSDRVTACPVEQSLVEAAANSTGQRERAFGGDHAGCQPFARNPPRATAPLLPVSSG